MKYSLEESTVQAIVSTLNGLAAGIQIGGGATVRHLLNTIEAEVTAQPAEPNQQAAPKAPRKPYTRKPKVALPEIKP